MLDCFLHRLSGLDPKPDFVFWTGDQPPHDVWAESKESQLQRSLDISGWLQTALRGIPVFPALGNHEGYPVNSFHLPPGESWLYGELAGKWAVWLPPSSLETFRVAGYYSSPIPNMQNVRVISLNMNYCNYMNPYLILSFMTADPGDMLAWLISTLQDAENAKERVYIIGHIPPGAKECPSHWSFGFNQIVDRYEDTIIGQYYGHTHYDQFEVFYETTPTATSPVKSSGNMVRKFTAPTPLLPSSLQVQQQVFHQISMGQLLPLSARPVGIAYITPSVTTYAGLNPSYRIYSVDAKSGYMMEISKYYVDVSEANEIGSPTWTFAYNASTMYSLDSLFPSNWDIAIDKISTNDSLFEDYFRNMYSFGSRAYQTCNAACRKEVICAMCSSYFSKFLQCLGGN